MDGTTFAEDLSKAAQLADANCLNGMRVRIRLNKYGFHVSGKAISGVRAVDRDYTQMVTYRDVELSDGFALYVAVRNGRRRARSRVRRPVSVGVLG